VTFKPVGLELTEIWLGLAGFEDGNEVGAPVGGAVCVDPPGVTLPPPPPPPHAESAAAHTKTTMARAFLMHMSYVTIGQRKWNVSK
jgi:hypothetical protein